MDELYEYATTSASDAQSLPLILNNYGRYGWRTISITADPRSGNLTALLERNIYSPYKRNHSAHERD